MNPDTIYLKDWLTLIALLLGPLLAVWWTLWYQARMERRNIKFRHFITLMGHRKSIPISPDWALALNLIDVVYADDPRIVAKWHALYEVLCTKPLDETKFQHASLELMSAIARSLGFSELEQTDIDKFYVPDQHAAQASRNFEVQTEALRVLKASKSFGDPI